MIPEPSPEPATWVKTFKVIAGSVALLAVLFWVIGSGSSSGAFLGNLIAGAIGCLPGVLYLTKVNRSTAILTCGAALLLGTPAWIIPIFSDNPFSFFWALFVVLPVTLFFCIVGAATGDRTPRDRPPWWNPTG